MQSESLPTTMSRVKGERLYIGSLFSIREPNSLQEAGITHILTLLNTSFKPPSVYTTLVSKHDLGPVTKPDLHHDANSSLLPISEISCSIGHIIPTHLIIPIHDEANTLLLPHLPEAVTYIRKALDSNNDTGTVLVHCNMGKSRSCAVVAAYLISITKESVSDVLTRIKKSRPSMSINPGFISQLEIWRDMGCPLTKCELERKMPLYKHWKIGADKKKEKTERGPIRLEGRKSRDLTSEWSQVENAYPMEKERPEYEPIILKGRQSRDWKEEGAKVVKALEKIDNELGGALTRNVEYVENIEKERVEELQQTVDRVEAGTPSRMGSSSSVKAS